MRENAGWRPARPEMHSRPLSAAIDQQPAPGVVALAALAPRQQLARQRPAQLLVQVVAAELACPSSASEIASTASWAGSAKPSS